MSLNDDTVGIEKLDGICSPNILRDTFSGIFLHPSILLDKY